MVDGFDGSQATVATGIVVVVGIGAVVDVVVVAFELVEFDEHAAIIAAENTNIAADLMDFIYLSLSLLRHI